MSEAPVLSVRRLGKSFDARRVAHDISFDAGAGEVVCLLGPSGSGKSTVLRIVAGIERASEGEVWVGGRAVESPDSFVPPEKRRVGLVFQDLALFPHLNTRANAMFGLARQSRAEAGARADRLLAMVGLAGHSRSFPHQLSGGEQQRLAVARALAPAPRVMLLDEPFSGLDDRLRDDVRREVLEVLKAEGAATLFVTHDPDEALRSADRIVLLRKGLVAQAGTPDEIWRRPVDLGAAAFFSQISVIPGVRVGDVAATALGPVTAQIPGADGPVQVALRPRDLAVDAGGVELAATETVLGSDGLHVRFAAANGLPAGVSGVFDPLTGIRPRVPVRISIRPGHGFVFPAGAA